MRGGIVDWRVFLRDGSVHMWITVVGQAGFARDNFRFVISLKG
jgi:hypothetical protein